jgi:orotidine-5'-phosphate decarboxylase
MSKLVISIDDNIIFKLFQQSSLMPPCMLKIGWLQVLAATAATTFAGHMLDVKLFDTPDKVYKIVSDLTHHFEPAFLSVHAAGGREMLNAAYAAAAGTNTELFAVGVMTTDHAARGIEELSRNVELATMALETGINYLSCSMDSVHFLKTMFPALKLIVPGIRMGNSDLRMVKDHARVHEPTDRRVDYYVVGRPITQSAAPFVEAKRYFDVIDAL